MEKIKIDYLRDNISYLTINELSEDLGVPVQDVIETIIETDVMDTLIYHND